MNQKAYAFSLGETSEFIGTGILTVYLKKDVVLKNINTSCSSSRFDLCAHESDTTHVGDRQHLYMRASMQCVI